MIEFRQMTDDEALLAEMRWGVSLEEEAARQRQVAACAEREGGHEWELILDEPDDGDGSVALYCAACPANANDLISDGDELLWLEFDGYEVRDGKHNCPRAAVIPVDVEPWGSKSWTDCGWEYDAGINLEQRGPARYDTDDDQGENT